MYQQYMIATTKWRTVKNVGVLFARARSFAMTARKSGMRLILRWKQGLKPTRISWSVPASWIESGVRFYKYL